MTRDELRADCERAVKGNHGIRLVSTTGKQPLRGFRGELLCVNSAGEHVYRYAPKQCARLLALLDGDAE